MDLPKSIIVMVMVMSQQILLPNLVGAVPAVGVNYGLVGDNLPPPKDVISFIRSKGISRVRLFEPIPEVLEALKGYTDIAVSLGTRNEELPNLAMSQQAATDWINRNIIPYSKQVSFIWITADASLKALGGFQDTVVTTVVPSTVLSTSYPPSEAVFNDENMINVAKYLNEKGFPLMINVYPYFAIASDPAHITLDYALFKSHTPVIMDGKLAYYNLFDSIFDAFVASIEKAVGSKNINVPIIVSESGWPSAGGPLATVENARTYNNNLKAHFHKGTPRYNKPFDVFLFAVFNENQKAPGVEQNFVLEALRGFTDIAVSVGTRNEDLASLANSQQAATDWLNTNIVPYYNNVAIVWITAGNEVIPGENAQYVLPAIQNLQAGLQTLGLRNVVVTTVVATSVLATSYPPSQGAFGDQNMIDVVEHLNGNGLPLMINLYPYFALVSDPTHISL
ncbi:hypothetical protein IFM89_037565, partial [Coptis chinensis]